MPPATHAANDEAAFMNGLFEDLDRELSKNSKENKSSAKNASPRTPKSTRETQSKPTPTCKSRVEEADDFSALLDGAEGWNWEDMESDFLTPKKMGTPNKSKGDEPDILHAQPYTPDTSTRCIVKGVVEQLVAGRLQKILSVRVDPGSECRSVVLCDDWTQADIQSGDVINVIGSFSTTSSASSPTSPIPTITVNLKHNLLIHHPDVLVTATALSGISSCKRRPLLSSLIRSSSDFTPSLVWGNILHEVVQACLSEGKWDDIWIEQRIDEVMSRELGDLLRINFSEAEAKKEVKARARGLRGFADKYVSQLPKENATLSDTRCRDQVPLLAITQLHDVEEDIWSPMYGIKGKLDATVQAIISSPPEPSPFTSARRSNPPVLFTSPMPFEIKTGRAIQTMEHRAQTMLYTLLASERYNVKVDQGLLYYTQSEEVMRVPQAWNELRGLIVGRNELAGWIMKRVKASLDNRTPGPGELDNDSTFLPPTIDNERICKRCFALDSCMLYRKAVERVVDTTSPIADTYALKTGHLTPAQCHFFEKWENLISLEEGDLVRFRKELWTMGAAERERAGRCFSNMRLDDTFQQSSFKNLGKGEKIRRSTYRFVRDGGPFESKSLLNGQMCVGDAVTISVEPDLLALAKGYIWELTPDHIVVGVDHEISLEIIGTRLLAHRDKHADNGQVIFRIDKDEMFGGMGRIRDNLTRLFYVDGDKTSLELIVDLRKPRFVDAGSIDIPPDSLAPLNTSQRRAVMKVLTAEDYALILGMPGTGKTTVIAALIRILVGLGKSVLLTSYTHSAVDTILAKLDQETFEILRLGNVDKVHTDVRKFTPASKRMPATVEELKHQLLSPPVVATTCLSIEHVIFSLRRFDYCIVDEASQITLPTCLGPLRYADKFALVGDHFQLPPLVRNKRARKGGLDISLFRRLSDAHPHAVVDLTHQYRMNEDIMLLSNKLIYGDRLYCGSQTVAQRTLSLPNKSLLESLHSPRRAYCDAGRCWVEKLMAENCKVAFVDTELVPARDSRVGDLVHNTTEATLIHQITELLIRCGVEQNNIGIISLYRQQIKLLSNMLQDRPDVEILTVDRSQGRDKDCVIVSMVRSNEDGQIGELVKDWRRMNVSFTRARSKLIIFGSRKTLQAAPLLSEFFDLMDSQGWIISLPFQGDKIHPLPLTSKRVARDMDDHESRKENVAPTALGQKKPRIHERLLNGRPMLRDVLNNEK